MTLVLAHGSAHWLESVIMVLPIPIVLGFIAVATLRERRRARNAHRGASDSTSST